MTNSRGHSIQIALSPSSDGFNPLELQSAALGVCTALNLRREAASAHVAKEVRELALYVQGFKGDAPPSRLQRFALDVAIEGDVPVATKSQIVDKAHLACTIANTLRAPAVIEAALKQDGGDVAALEGAP